MENVCGVLPCTVEDLVTLFQAAVTAVDASMLRHIRDIAVRPTAVCPEVDGGPFEHLL
jgi:exosortase/archaeosortase